MAEEMMHFDCYQFGKDMIEGNKNDFQGNGHTTANYVITILRVSLKDFKRAKKSCLANQESLRRCDPDQ